MDPNGSPTAEMLREKAAEIVSRPDYNLASKRPDSTWMFSMLQEVLSWILLPFRWIYELTKGLPDLLRWTIVVVLSLIALALIAHIIYSFFTAIRSPKRLNPLGLSPRQRSTDPEELERLALEAASRGEFISGVRMLFRASVARLELIEKRPNRPGTTNRELLRRYRTKPQLGEALRQFVETIDRKWYGDEVCSDADFDACRMAHQRLVQAVGEPVDAVRA